MTSKCSANTLADDYILIDPRGRVHTKEQYLEHLSKGKANPKFEDLKETDVKVRVFGDTAVVTGLLHVKGKLQDKDVSAEYRWTRVYNKKGDSGSASSSSTPMSFPRKRQSNEQDRPWRKPSGRKG